MSTFTDKFNKKRTFDVNTDGLPYINLKGLYDQFGADRLYPIRAVYINTKSEYGDSPVVVTDTHLVNLPQHMLKTAQDILADKDAINDIKGGDIGFKVIEYTSKRRDEPCYSVEFIDL